MGRIFLAGDAAHIHSPVGGQGMNTGIHDALNLGHRMACVLRRGHDARMLDGYERDRMPIARSVLRRTDRAFRAVLALNTSRWRRVRLWLAPRVVAMPWFQRRLLRMMSQVDVARKEMAERASS
jgi:2-polyprenyl-6-methoxyphenol hydroxylase-like FAD-dependent oxidoreductase